MSLGAPATVITASICFPAFKRFAKFSRDETPDGSLPSFESGDIAFAQPVSARLPRGFCFLHLPSPAVLWPSLAVWFPWQENNRLTMFHVNTRVT
jgi:hypothetical protein